MPASPSASPSVASPDQPGSTPPGASSRAPMVLVVVTLAVLAALFPVMRSLDEGIDRQRVMYDARLEMAGLQHVSLSAGVAPSAVEVAPGEAVEVGSQTFEAPEGVRVEVRPEGDGYCVRAEDDHGDETTWLCHDLSDPPLVPAEMLPSP